MPALSPTMTEGIINQWLVKVGDTVKAGDIIAEIETDKATMEVEAVDEGKITHLLEDTANKQIPVNSVIAIIDGDDSEIIENKIKIDSNSKATNDIEIQKTKQILDSKISQNNNSQNSDDRLKASPLVKKIAKEKKHCFISTGMSTIEQIQTAVNIFEKYQCPFDLQHSNSSYPMKPEEANLKCIQSLKDKFHCNVGYSGHESMGYLICVSAVLLGASSIERHITLDRSMYGSDQAASIELSGMKNLSESIKKIFTALGKPSLGKVIDDEVPIAKKLRAHIKH